MMVALQGFWSYVHHDDQADGGRISQLARDVVDQYEMLIGEKISLFLDKDVLDWGENWRDEIDSSLAYVAFFIPVITPRYFMSPECRRELHFFARRASELGIKELILPLLYVDFPGLHEENTKDELIQLVCTFQWENWCDLRFYEINSEEYRRGVNRLAIRLVDANRQAEETFAARSDRMNEIHEDSTDDSPGFIDLLATSEEMLSRLPETLGSMTDDIKKIGEIMNGSTEELRRAETQGKGFSARLLIAKRTAVKMDDPTERIWEQSNVYASQLHDVDQGIRILIERAPHEIAENSDARQEYCELFESVREMSDASNYMINNLQTMVDASESLEKFSRDLRPVMRRLKSGITILMESSRVCKEWINLIDATNINCEDTNKLIE